MRFELLEMSYYYEWKSEAETSKILYKNFSEIILGNFLKDFLISFDEDNNIFSKIIFVEELRNI